MRKPLALIFEDEPMIVIDIVASLREAGFAVASEPICNRARQILALVEPDVVILDVLLQDCISSSVAEELVARNIPFVIYSATDVEGRGEPSRPVPLSRNLQTNPCLSLWRIPWLGHPRLRERFEKARETGKCSKIRCQKLKPRDRLYRRHEQATNRAVPPA
ncbi:hypothetical protein [Mesorhizobium sp.]|uniref:hypothetical protein n=1 Tax=Mesorhizobium sp. TaxID=1871066 RepID=UPI000FE86EA3|nr:hypothetical protein [Mesorhizobium sp.]RWI12563.1 MAG: hypothetical protein EOQ90_02620 [Mesorhizobium sp.]RWM83185.1 MAG: hypothetical protein EOR83_19515 [Mesorhizobium sp.]